MVTTPQVLCLHILLIPKNKTEQRKQTNEKPYMSQTRIDANGRIKIWFRYSKEMYLLLPLIVCALHLKKLQIYQNERWKSLKFLSQSHGVAQIANTELGKFVINFRLNRHMVGIFKTDGDWSLSYLAISLWRKSPRHWGNVYYSFPSQFKISKIQSQ